MRAKKRRTSVLSPEATRIVNDVIACLRIPYNQQFYAQNQVMTRHYDDFKTKTVCGTEGCLAGWMLFVSKPRIHKAIERALLAPRQTHKTMNIISQYDILKLSAETMTLKNGQPAYTDNLFAGSGEAWPNPFATMWSAANGDKAKEARVAIKRLEHFKFTGE